MKAHQIRPHERSQKAYTEERSCEVCGKPFFLNSNRTKLTCSEECRHKRMSKKQMERRRLERQLVRQETLKKPKLCLFCGTKFMRTKVSQKRCPKCIERRITRVNQIENRKRRAESPTTVGESHQEFINRLHLADIRSRERFSERLQQVDEITGETGFKEEIERFLSSGGKVQVLPAAAEETTSPVNQSSFSFTRYGETSAAAFGLPEFLGGTILGASESRETGGIDHELGV